MHGEPHVLLEEAIDQSACFDPMSAMALFVYLEEGAPLPLYLWFFSELNYFTTYLEIIPLIIIMLTNQNYPAS